MKLKLTNPADVLNKLHRNRYSELFHNHRFDGMQTIIEWLKNQFVAKIHAESSIKAVAFDIKIISDSIRYFLNRGDKFYSKLFDEKGLIPDNNDDLKVEFPLTEVVRRLYNDIWEIYYDSSGLTVYSELKSYLEKCLGEYIAIDISLQSLKVWRCIYEQSNYNLRDFGKYWLDSIPLNNVMEFINQLTYVDPAKQLEELTSSMMRKERFFQDAVLYDPNFETNKEKSNWEYVCKYTHHSGMLSFNEELCLNQFLILKTKIKYWLEWIDNLRFPVLQDHAFYHINALNKYEEIVQTIVTDKHRFNTRSEYLLLITLKNYYDFVLKVAGNLHGLKKGDWYAHDEQLKTELVELATEQHSLFMSEEIKTSFKNILQSIFKDTKASTAKYFSSVFEWINSYKVQGNIRNDYDIVKNGVTSILNDVFQERLNQGAGNKRTLLESVSVSKLNWQYIEKFVRICEVDETDNDYRDALSEKILSFIAHDNFKWNLEKLFNSKVLDQAIYLSYLFCKRGKVLEEWNKLYLKHKYYHQGWNVPKQYDAKLENREIYVLITGVGIAYIYLDEGKDLEAQNTIDIILDAVISQHRAKSRSFSEQYRLVLRFLAYVIVRFDKLRINDFIDRIVKEIDDLESCLVTIAEMITQMDTNVERMKELDFSSAKARMDQSFWMLEVKYTGYGWAFDEKLKSYQNFKTMIEEVCSRLKR